MGEWKISGILEMNALQGQILGEIQPCDEDREDVNGEELYGRQVNGKIRYISECKTTQEVILGTYLTLLKRII